MTEKDEQKHPKRPRIKHFSYEGYFAYFLTVCTHSKNKLFTSNEIVEPILKYLKETSLQFGFQIYAYCFMPDHLHILVLAENVNASLKNFVKIFKQKSGYYFKQKYRIKLWQPSFYDHILRRRESLNSIAEYIFFNPIRKKLVKNYKEYPYLGSLMFNI